MSVLNSLQIIFRVNLQDEGVVILCSRVWLEIVMGPTCAVKKPHTAVNMVRLSRGLSGSHTTTLDAFARWASWLCCPSGHHHFTLSGNLLSPISSLCGPSCLSSNHSRSSRFPPSHGRKARYSQITPLS